MPTVVDDTTRRRFLAVLGAAGLLAGCAAGDPDDAPPAPATRDVEDSTGRRVTIPVRPQRIAALHDDSAGIGLLSLGAPVVALGTRNGALSPRLAGRFDLAGVAPAGDVFTWDLERIAAARPDLVVAFVDADTGRSDTGALSAGARESLAPTFYLNQAQPLDEFMAVVGDLAGRPDEVTRQREQWETELAAARTRLGPLTSALSFASLSADGGVASVSSTADPTGLPQLGRLLGMRMPPVAQSDTIFVELSLERLGELAVDVVYHYGPPPATPLWDRLPAVAAGQAREQRDTDIVPGATYVSYRATLDFLERTLAGVRNDVVDESAW